MGASALAMIALNEAKNSRLLSPKLSHSWYTFQGTPAFSSSSA
jgi:hypothetical protein